jgi:type III pantothenate kinase
LTLFGNTTQDCVWGGTVHAVAAAIDGMTTRMRADLGDDVECLLTGGDAEDLLPYLQGGYRLMPELIFEGLLVIAAQGPEKKRLSQGDAFDLIGQRQ